MLKKLAIEQFVIIDKLALEFQPGLTVLTGETGAGKSILLDAMGLILGDASTRKAIRQGAEEATIEAQFAPPASNPVWQFLAGHGLVAPPQQDFTIRRVLRTDDNDEVKLNGKDVSLEVLKEAGTYLSEIHGQFANQSLLDPSNQLRLLDLSADFTPEIYTNVATTLRNLHAYHAELKEEGEFYSQNMSRVGQMEAIAEKIESAGLLESGFEEIRAEYARLLTAYETSEAFQEITSHLVASNGAIKLLSAANMALARQKNLDAEKIQDLSDYLSTAVDHARAALDETARLAPEYDIDTAPLRLYKERMGIIETLAEDLRVPLADLSTYAQNLLRDIGRIRHRARLNELEVLIKQAQEDYRRYAHELTEKRAAAAQILSDDITALLPPLKLMRAEFNVKVTEEAREEFWTEKGFNTVTFTARMNPGMPFSPITETASGGELARLVLAVKVVLQGVQSIPTLVFDEVDTGIGGAAAAAVGERISHLAETTQVMVITHSPQVASRGDQHLYVSKKSDGAITTSGIRELSMDERVDEISRMLAGNAISPESRAAAKSLIDEAHATTAARKSEAKQA